MKVQYVEFRCAECRKVIGEKHPNDKIRVKRSFMTICCKCWLKYDTILKNIRKLTEQKLKELK